TAGISVGLRLRRRHQRRRRIHRIPAPQAGSRRRPPAAAHCPRRGIRTAYAVTGLNMNFLSRILTRTPCLPARVVGATIFGASSPVLIACSVVWFGIANDRKDRLARRL